jgi:tetratricopeptide (TPR) repeat protein
MSRLAVTLYWAQPADRKFALSADAVAMARRLGHTSTIAYALAGRIAALSGPDDVETRLAAATEMRELAERCDARELAMIARGWCIADSLALGHISDVRRDIETFAAAAVELRHPYFVWWSAALRTMQALLDGRMKDAETLSEDAMRLASRAVVSDAMQVYAGHSYVLCIEQERHQQLESILTAFVQSFPHIPGTHCALALLHADRGRAVEAEAEMATLAADDFAALPRNPEWLSCIAALAETSALLADAPYAATLYRLLAPYRDRVIVAGLGVLCSGSVARSLGLLATRLGRFDEAAAHLDEALRVHERIGAVMWTAYTHHAYACLAVARGAPGDAELAASSRATALNLAEKLGMTRLRGRVLAIDPTAMARPQRHVAYRTGTLRLEGDYWLLRWGNTEFRLRDSVGLRYLATLIENPSREFLAFDLVTTRTGVDAAANASRGAAGSVTALLGDAGPLLDRRARHAYGRRLDELRAAVDEAQAFHDSDRARAAQAEIDALAGELARAVGLGGRGRRAAAPLERARVSATRAIHAAVRRIHENDANLAQYLGGTIKTGTFCSYTPDPGTPVSWTLR